MNKSEWKAALKPYMAPDLKKSLWQLINSVIPYIILFVLMIFMVLKGYPYPLVLLVAILESLFMARVFIIFHDCTHGSFFKSPGANRFAGYLLGMASFTPYSDWQHAHALHHGNVGNLDKRGIGDIPTMTVAEYRKAPRVSKILYRIVRSPFFLLLIAPVAIFLLSHRFPQASTRRQELFSIIFVNLYIAALLTAAHFTIGIGTLLMVQLPITILGGSFGLWLFYVQHQFESVYWSRKETWDNLRASLEGSSFYRLPSWLNWFTASIGYHHIHHLNARIPNYNLKKVYDEVEAARDITPLTPRVSLRSLFYNLYDEEKKRMTSFSSIKLKS